VVFRLTAVDFDVRTDSWRTPVSVMPVGPGDSVLVGREGDLPVGIDPVDPGVSRRALTVTVEAAMGAGSHQFESWVDTPVGSAPDVGGIQHHRA